MRFLGTGFTAVTAAAIAAVVLAQQGESPDLPGEVDINAQPPAAEAACFNARTVRNFDGLDDEHVYVEGPNDEHYLLTMSQRCLGLRTAESIVISNPSSRICSNSLAELTYVGTGGRAETCWITRVEQVESRAGAAELAELRRQRSR
jgi:hypothetical protein